MATSVIDMTPAIISWKVYAGDRNSTQIQLFATDDIPWDVTGAEFKAQARLDVLDATVALEATFTIDDAVGGLVTVAWDGEEVRTLLGASEEWVGVYDLQIKEAGQTLPVTLFSGPFTATMDVTKV